MMTKAELEQVVEATIHLAREHWVKTGSAVRQEDAPIMVKDVILHLGLVGLLTGDVKGST